MLAQAPSGIGTSQNGAGTRSGQDVSLRYYGSIGGVYDSGLVPFAADAQGNLVRVPGIYGMEARLGAYGVRNWRHAQLGLDYAGAFRHYPERPFFDSIDQGLALRWTHQLSERFSYALNQSAGTYGRAGAIRTGFDPANDNPSATPASQFFDTRTYYSVSGASATYMQSARTAYSISGDAFVSNRRAQGLADSWGYGLTGLWNHRISQRTNFGARYAFQQFYTPNLALDSISHTFEGTYGRLLGQRWTLDLRGGVFTSETNSLQTIHLNPILASIFGVPSITFGLNRKNVFPSGSFLLTRQFSRALFRVTYGRSMGGGNGLISISRLESGTVGISYTGIQHWNLGVDGGYYGWKDLSGGLTGTATYNVGGGATYDLTRYLHLSGRYDARHFEIDTQKNYPRSSSRVVFGLSFSPGDLPLSLW